MAYLMYGGKRVTLLFDRNKVRIKTGLSPLTAPTISIDGDTLTMTATDDRTQEFVIFVDGVEMATVMNGTEETYTVSGTWDFNKEIDHHIPNDGIEVQFVSDGAVYNLMYTTMVGSNEYLTYGNDTTDDYAYSMYDGWTNQAYRTITFVGTQTVSKEFYEWLVANAQPQIQTGTYIFNKTITYIPDVLYLNFSSNGLPYEIMADYEGDNELNYVYGNAGNTAYDYADNTWRDEVYRTVEVNTAQAVSKELYDWFVENTTYKPHPEEV